MKAVIACLALVLSVESCTRWFKNDASVQLGPRPFYLIDRMHDGALKDQLSSCREGPFYRSDFSMAHRGAPLQFPEHSEEGYKAAVRMGAGFVECDIVTTADDQMICQHQNDALHRTTDIVRGPFAGLCTTPFSPATDAGFASAMCRTSDVTLEQFMQLGAKMDGAYPWAVDTTQYLRGAPNWRTELYARDAGTLMSHAGSIALLDQLDVNFAPELKLPVPGSPEAEGFDPIAMADRVIADYRVAKISPKRLRLQSFSPEVIVHWQNTAPDYAAEAALLIASEESFNGDDPATWLEDFKALKAMGIKRLAPSVNMLLSAKDEDIVPSAYALAAKEAGFELITWTLERSSSIKKGGYYFDPIEDILNTEGQIFNIIDVLARDVGVLAILSDWPATVTYYANCMGFD